MSAQSRFARLCVALLVIAVMIAACGQQPAAAPAPAAPAQQAQAQQPAAPAQKPAEPAKPAAPAVDMNAAVVKYISGLPDGFNGVAPAKAQEQMAATKVFVLDVREPKELQDNGFIKGAVNIPIRTLAKNLDKLPAKDQPILVYCAIGHRGALALEALNLLGYTNVKSISGGVNAWKAANLPVEMGEPVKPTAGTAAQVDAVTLAAMDKYLSGLPDGFNGVAPAKAQEQIAASKPFILDVREPKELQDNGMIEAAVNVPLRELFKDTSKLPQDKNAPILVYCAIGHRGGLALMALNLMGYTNVKSISGGLNAWKAANLPVTQPKS